MFVALRKPRCVAVSTVLRLCESKQWQFLFELRRTHFPPNHKPGPFNPFPRFLPSLLSTRPWPPISGIPIIPPILTISFSPKKTPRLLEFHSPALVSFPRFPSPPRGSSPRRTSVPRFHLPASPKSLRIPRFHPCVSNPFPLFPLPTYPPPAIPCAPLFPMKRPLRSPRFQTRF